LKFIREVWGEASKHERLYNALLEAKFDQGLAPETHFYASEVKRLVPDLEMGDVHDVLMWLALGMLGVLELRFHFRNGESVSASDGLLGLEEGRYNAVDLFPKYRWVPENERRWDPETRKSRR